MVSTGDVTGVIVAVLTLVRTGVLSYGVATPAYYLFNAAVW